MTLKEYKEKKLPLLEKAHSIYGHKEEGLCSCGSVLRAITFYRLLNQDWESLKNLCASNEEVFALVIGFLYLSDKEKFNNIIRFFKEDKYVQYLARQAKKEANINKKYMNFVTTYTHIIRNTICTFDEMKPSKRLRDCVTGIGVVYRAAIKRRQDEKH
jgi:ribonucleotide reductase beta subunit family protein with ferritin-like domain